MSKYRQVSPLKFYLAKYFFLALALLQWAIAAIFFLRYGQNLKGQYTALNFFTLGALMFVLFLFINEKLKRVALGKKKIVVLNRGRQVILWCDVKSLKLIPFINVYRLKQKGKKKGIYFFPSKNIDPVYGLLAKDSRKMENLLKKISP